MSDVAASWQFRLLCEIAPISRFFGSCRFVFALWTPDGNMMDFRQAASHTAPHHSQVITDLTASQILETFLSNDGHRDGSRVSAQTAPVWSPRCCQDNCTCGRDESLEYNSDGKSDRIQSLL